MENLKAVVFDDLFSLDERRTTVSGDRLMRLDLAEARIMLK